MNSKHMIKKILLGALALFVFAVPASANAGTLSDDGLGVTHVSNFSRYPNTNSHWSRSETADAGQTVSFGIYYYNAGPGVASNVVVRLSPPSGGANNAYTLTGTIGGTNTNTLSGSATINLSSAQTLTPAGIYNWDRNTTGTGPALANGSAMLTSGGVSLGDLAEGEYGTVVARFTVGNQQAVSVNEPIVTTNGTTNVTSTSCTFNGFVDARGSSNVTTWFEYGFGSGFGQTSGFQNFSGTGANSISASAFNLNPNTNYSFRAVAQRSGGPLVYGSTQTCTTSNSVSNNQNDPSVQTNSASNIGQNSATLNGFVDPRNNSSVTTYFEFGPTSSLGQTVGFQTLTNSGATSIAFTNFNLNPNTTYYYRAVAQRNGGPSVYGSIVNFTTTGFGVNNVNTFVTTQPATRTNSSTTWVLNGLLSNTGGSQFTPVYFQYGETTSLGNQTSSQSLFSGSFSATAANLVPGRIYYFRAVSQGNGGTSYGQILSFTTDQNFTINTNTTQVTTLDATNRTSSSLQLNAQVFNSGTCQATSGFYEFGSTNSLGNQTPVQTIASGSSATFYRIIQNLVAGRTYFYRAVAQDSCGNTVRGNILSASTFGSAPVAPAPNYVAPVVAEVVQSPFVLSFGYAPLRPFPGSEVTYRIGWKNDSGIKLNDALLRVNLPEGITFLSTESGFIRDGEKNLLRPIGTVAKGASGAYLFRARIESNVVLASDPAMGIQLSFFNPSTGANGSVSIKGITRIGDGVSALNGTNNTITTTVIDNNTSGSVAVTGTPTGDVTTGLAFFGGLGGIFPTTGPGWILLILAVILLLAVVRHYFLTDTRPKV